MSAVEQPIQRAPIRRIPTRPPSVTRGDVPGAGDPVIERKREEEKTVPTRRTAVRDRRDPDIEDKGTKGQSRRTPDEAVDDKGSVGIGPIKRTTTDRAKRKAPAEDKELIITRAPTPTDLPEEKPRLSRAERQKRLMEQTGVPITTDLLLDLGPLGGTARISKRLADDFSELSTGEKVRDIFFAGLSAVGDVTVFAGPGLRLGSKMLGRGGGTVVQSFATSSVDESVGIMIAAQKAGQKPVVRIIVAGGDDQLLAGERIVQEIIGNPQVLKKTKRIILSAPASDKGIADLVALDNALADFPAKSIKKLQAELVVDRAIAPDEIATIARQAMGEKFRRVTVKTVIRESPVNDTDLEGLARFLAKEQRRPVDEVTQELKAQFSRDPSAIKDAADELVRRLGNAGVRVRSVDEVIKPKRPTGSTKITREVVLEPDEGGALVRVGGGKDFPASGVRSSGGTAIRKATVRKPVLFVGANPFASPAEPVIVVAAEIGTPGKPASTPAPVRDPKKEPASTPASVPDRTTTGTPDSDLPGPAPVRDPKTGQFIPGVLKQPGRIFVPKRGKAEIVHEKFRQPGPIFVPKPKPTPAGATAPTTSTQTQTQTSTKAATGQPTSTRAPSKPINRGSGIVRVPSSPPGKQTSARKLRGRFPLVVRFQQGLFVNDVNLKTGVKTIVRKATDPTRKVEKTFRVIETTNEPFKPKTFNLGIVRQLVSSRDVMFRRDRTFRERRGI